jgi:hypothetical protein
MKAIKEHCDDRKEGYIRLNNGFHEKAEANCGRSKQAAQSHRLMVLVTHSSKKG